MAEAEAVKDPNDPSAALFGERELNRSQCDPELRFKKELTAVCNIDASADGSGGNLCIPLPIRAAKT